MDDVHNEDILIIGHSSINVDHKPLYKHPYCKYSKSLIKVEGYIGQQPDQRAITFSLTQEFSSDLLQTYCNLTPTPIKVQKQEMFNWLWRYTRLKVWAMAGQCYPIHISSSGEPSAHRADDLLSNSQAFENKGFGLI